nr:MAG TPA: hypothetical protein [Caudoviricetes sp.]
MYHRVFRLSNLCLSSQISVQRYSNIISLIHFLY